MTTTYTKDSTSSTFRVEYKDAAPTYYFYRGFLQFSAIKFGLPSDTKYFGAILNFRISAKSGVDTNFRVRYGNNVLGSSLDANSTEFSKCTVNQGSFDSADYSAGDWITFNLTDYGSSIRDDYRIAIIGETTKMGIYVYSGNSSNKPYLSLYYLNFLVPGTYSIAGTAGIPGSYSVPPAGVIEDINYVNSVVDGHILATTDTPADIHKEE